MRVSYATPIGTLCPSCGASGAVHIVGARTYCIDCALGSVAFLESHRKREDKKRVKEAAEGRP